MDDEKELFIGKFYIYNFLHLFRGAVQEGNDLHLAAIAHDLVFRVGVRSSSFLFLFLQIAPCKVKSLAKISASLSHLDPQLF